MYNIATAIAIAIYTLHMLALLHVLLRALAAMRSVWIHLSWIHFRV
jgi:hypothetical protein